MLRHGLAEFESVQPQPQEDEQLAAEAERLTHAESLAQAAVTARAGLGGDAESVGAAAARDLTVAAHAALDAAAGHDAGLDALGTRVREVVVLLDELAADLSACAATIEQDPARLAAVQDRRAAITSLLRKYGPSLPDALAWQAKSADRMLELGDDDDAVATLEAELGAVEPQLRDLATRISAVRSAAAGSLSARVSEELAALAMPSARLEVRVVSDATGEPGPHGLDEVEILFAANSGAGLRPLHKAASGGELSRVMLALEVILADRTSMPTFVFDEVDAGIGGKAAVEVGRRLGRLASNCQVIAVTHLPQVAAFATHHFRVTKNDDGSVTSSSVVRLEAEDRVDELARMLAGQEDSTAARDHARELLALATTPD
jgi:DNA repair protein RecN (Recombination protein N)